MVRRAMLLTMAVCLPIFNLMSGFMPTPVTINGASVNWCVARSDASNEALQLALDYACGSGADCTPLQENGLCFLPNTIPAHASYAFNSYFQRKSMAAGSCDFSGTASIARTDPSYGSCVYPSSLSTAGGATPTIMTPTSTNSPNTDMTPAFPSPAIYNGTSGTNVNFTTMPPTLPPDNSTAPFSLPLPFPLLLAVLFSLTTTDFL